MSRGAPVAARNLALALGALLVVSAATTVPRVTHAGAPDAAHAARPGTDAAPHVVLRLDAGAVTVSGTVQSDAQRTILVAAARYAVGAAHVRDALVVAPSGPRDVVADERTSALAVLVTNLAKASRADVRFGPDGLVLRAEVADDATRALFVALAAAVTAGGAGDAPGDVLVVVAPAAGG